MPRSGGGAAVGGMARSGVGAASGSHSGGESGLVEGPRVFKGRPGGTKAAKDDQFRLKHREAGLQAQAAAIEKMAEAQMLKAVGLQDQNLLLLMTTDDAALANVEAREYMQLRRVQELPKLKHRLAEEAEAELELQTARARAGLGRRGFSSRRDSPAAASAAPDREGGMEGDPDSTTEPADVDPEYRGAGDTPNGEF